MELKRPKYHWSRRDNKAYVADELTTEDVERTTIIRNMVGHRGSRPEDREKKDG